MKLLMCAALVAMLGGCVAEYSDRGFRDGYYGHAGHSDRGYYDRNGNYHYYGHDRDRDYDHDRDWR